MILLDTHVWWWSLVEPENLSETAITHIERAKTDERFISCISLWEFAMMAAKKKISLSISPSAWLIRAIKYTAIAIVDLSPEIAVESCQLPGTFHKDPADRIIVATARVNNLKLLTKDQKILDYPNVNATW